MTSKIKEKDDFSSEGPTVRVKAADYLHRFHFSALTLLVGLFDP